MPTCGWPRAHWFKQPAGFTASKKPDEIEGPE